MGGWRSITSTKCTAWVFPEVQTGKKGVRVKKTRDKKTSSLQQQNTDTALCYGGGGMCSSEPLLQELLPQSISDISLFFCAEVFRPRPH